jgi:hypothetical protein
MGLSLVAEAATTRQDNRAHAPEQQPKDVAGALVDISVQVVGTTNL